jgi:hypothetical protein
MTASTTHAPLEMRSMSAGRRDLELFAACFARNSFPRSLDALDWQYHSNPTGRVFVDFALATDRLAAIYASLPVYVRVAGTVRLALQSLDTMTDADFRGRGLFVKLATRTFARAQREGAAFVYGFPNGQSAHGFFERVQWTKLDPLPFLIRPLRTEYVLRRFGARRAAKILPNLQLYPLDKPSCPPHMRVEPITRFDHRHAHVWERFSHGVGVAVERDAKYLNWRLVDKPERKYVNRAIVCGDEVVGWASHCVQEKHGGRIGYVMEALCLPGHERVVRSLLSHALADMRKERTDAVLAWCFSHARTYRSFLLRGFVPVPERFRPIELHGGVRAFDEGIGSIVRNRRSWYLSYLDADTV